MLYGNGLPQKRCADLVGVSRQTINNWYNKGKDYDGDDESNLYYVFYKEMLKAKAKFIMHHQKKINDSDDWRASKYLLEVTEPNTYVLEKRLNVKSEDNVKVSLSKEDIFEKVDKELGLL